MKIRVLGVLALCFGLIGITTAEEKEMNIVETAIKAGQFKTLAAALTKAELVDTLKGKGPFTVFAPTDEAFKKIPEETLKAVLADKKKLTKILMAHVVAEKSVMAADVMKMDGKEVNGFKLSTKDGVKIGDAKVVKADIKCSNGVIHVIDTVLIPKD